MYQKCRIRSRKIVARENRERYYIYVCTGTQPGSGSRRKAYSQISAWSEDELLKKLEKMEETGELPLVHCDWTYPEYAEQLFNEKKSGFELMKQVTGELRVAKTGIDDVKEIMRKIEAAEVSYAEKKACLRLIREILEDAVQCRVVRANLFSKVRLKQPKAAERKVLEGENLDHFLSMDPTIPAHAALLATFYAAARSGEMIACKYTNLNPATGGVQIAQQVVYRKEKDNEKESEKERAEQPDLAVTKTGRERVIYPGDGFYKVLRESSILNPTQREPDAFCFRGVGGKMISVKEMREAYREWMNGTGFEKEPLRILRRSRLTQLYFSGIPGALNRCAELAGHTNTRTTLLHYIVVTERRREALRNSDDAFYRGLLGEN